MLDQHGTVVDTRYLGFSKASDTESWSIFIWKHWHTLMVQYLTASNKKMVCAASWRGDKDDLKSYS